VLTRDHMLSTSNRDYHELLRLFGLAI
jgi:hypothetical protein